MPQDGALLANNPAAIALHAHEWPELQLMLFLVLDRATADDEADGILPAPSAASACQDGPRRERPSLRPQYEEENFEYAYQNAWQGALGETSVVGEPAVLLAAVDGTELPRADAESIVADRMAYLKELESGLERSAQLGVHGVPLFVIDESNAIPGAASSAQLLGALIAAASTPRRLAQHYVDTANTHDLPALAEQLATDVDMFGGPCDLSGLQEFFASYPSIHWEVTSDYRPLEGGNATVVFAYTRTWAAELGQRLAVDCGQEPLSALRGALHAFLAELLGGREIILEAPALAVDLGAVRIQT